MSASTKVVWREMSAFSCPCSPKPAPGDVHPFAVVIVGRDEPDYFACRGVSGRPEDEHGVRGVIIKCVRCANAWCHACLELMHMDLVAGAESSYPPAVAREMLEVVAALAPKSKRKPS